jgi:hypothetical protein
MNIKMETPESHKLKHINKLTIMQEETEKAKWVNMWYEMMSEHLEQANDIGINLCDVCGNKCREYSRNHLCYYCDYTNFIEKIQNIYSIPDIQKFFTCSCERNLIQWADLKTADVMCSSCMHQSEKSQEKSENMGYFYYITIYPEHFVKYYPELSDYFNSFNNI